MRNFYFFVFVALICFTLPAQIIDIPDPNFKAALVNSPIVAFNEYSWNLEDADTNDDGEIQVSEAETIQKLYLYNTNISSVEGIENFVNLKYFYAENSPLTYVDLSRNISLNTIGFYDMEALTHLLMKNGNDDTDPGPYGEGGFNIFNCPNLAYVCVDDFEKTAIQNAIGNGIVINSYCASQAAGDTVFEIGGKNSMDSDLNGCDTNDSYVDSVQYQISNGAETAIIASNHQGEFYFPLLAGNHTITPVIDDVHNASYFSANPASSSVSFPADGSSVTVDFCIIPNGPPIIYFPDADFKNILVNTNCVDTNGSNFGDSDADTNDDGEIQITEAEAVLRLRFAPYDIQDMTGIEYFKNLQRLVCKGTPSYSGIGDIGSLNLSQLHDLEYLDCSFNQISALTLSSAGNLKNLRCGGNNLRSLEISNHTQLEEIYASNYYPDPGGLGNNNRFDHVNLDGFSKLTGVALAFTNLESLSVKNCPELTYIRVENGNAYGGQGYYLQTLDLENNQNLVNIYSSYNKLTSLDLPQAPNLERLECKESDLTTLDARQNSKLRYLDLSLGGQLESIIVKNGSEFDSTYIPFEDIYVYEFEFWGNPDLTYICADEFDIENIKNEARSSIVVNSYCSFSPGGEFYTIEGTASIDAGLDGCDPSDTGYPYLKFDIVDGGTTGSFSADFDGNYNIPVQAGQHTVAPQLENPDYFTVSPASFVVDFPTDASPYVQDFCVTPNGVKNDLEVTLLPLSLARPGFDAQYKLIYKNKGTTALSGNVSLNFLDNVLDLSSASPTADSQNSGLLSWNFANLAPFESREIMVVMNLNSPTETPALNDGDLLTFTTNIEPFASDEAPEDNTFELAQTVVNSFDPNDKTCLEGSVVTPDIIGEFVHYLIRFENTGSASAINVVVKDVIDTTKFDIATLFITDSSHDMVTRINGNTVEFIFENINLPFDDATNDGHIAFKIRTLPSLQVGDSFDNDAEIYFDFNFPIVTNNAVTNIQNALSNDSFNRSGDILAYPNPVKDVLNLKLEASIEAVEVLDLSGRLLKRVALIGTQDQYTLDIKSLPSGLYVVKVQSDAGEFIQKVMKE